MRLQEPQQHASEPISSAPDWPDTTEAPLLWGRECEDKNGTSEALPVQLADGTTSQRGLAGRPSISETMSAVENPACHMTFFDMSTATQHQNGQFGMEDVDVDLPFSEAFPYGTSEQDLFMWADGEYFAPLYQGTYPPSGSLPGPEQAQPEHMDVCSVDDASEQSSSEDAPLPSFLDARSSPEPQAGQGMQFDTYVRATFRNRGYLQDALRDGQSSRKQNSPAEKAHHPPILGAFSPTLSQADDSKWEIENLAHVPPISQNIYDQIVANFKVLNDTNNLWTRFATGDFPSIGACNAFVQLYFEDFHSLFPLLHRPTFNPATEPWLLVLAIIATGCRFSRVPAAVECVDIMQEFVRRAFSNTIEKDYSSTCEPWLAQAGLLNQVGMQYSSDMRLIEFAQGMRSTIATICRKINCFHETERPKGKIERQQSCTDAWKSWVRKESKRRLAYTLWLVDSQYVLFLDQPPIIPTNLLRVRLPSLESLWHAPSATSWSECVHQNGMYLPGSIRKELNQLYDNKTRRSELGDFAILLLVLGVFRDALDLWRSSRAGIGLHLNTTHDFHAPSPVSVSMPITSPVIQKAMEYLQILCPEREEISTRSSLKSAIFHHYHTIGVVLGIPLGELVCFLGYRVTSADISHCRDRLRAWVQNHDRDARQVVLHAGRLFARIRHSTMHGYWEGRAIFIACLSLWIYGEYSQHYSRAQHATNGDLVESNPAATIRLDQYIEREAEQSWLQNGEGMRPCMAGVGGVLGTDGVSRLVQESSCVLSASSIWPISAVLGNALRIYHKLRSGTRL